MRSHAVSKEKTRRSTSSRAWAGCRSPAVTVRAREGISRQRGVCADAVFSQGWMDRDAAEGRMRTLLQLADELGDAQSRSSLATRSRSEAVVLWQHAQQHMRLPRQPLHVSFSWQDSRPTDHQLRRAGHLHGRGTPPIRQLSCTFELGCRISVGAGGRSPPPSARAAGKF